MLETHITKHKGKCEKCLDDILIFTAEGMYIFLIDGKSYQPFDQDYVDHIKDFKQKIEVLFHSEYKNSSFDKICDVCGKLAIPDDNYIIMHIYNGTTRTRIIGNLHALIVSDGKINDLPNGQYNLKDDDFVICTTDYFYSLLSKEAILIDALMSADSQEWAELLMNRISDKNKLLCYNLSCLTFRNRKV